MGPLYELYLYSYHLILRKYIYKEELLHGWTLLHGLQKITASANNMLIYNSGGHYRELEATCSQSHVLKALRNLTLPRYINRNPSPCMSSQQYPTKNDHDH